MTQKKGSMFTMENTVILIIAILSVAFIIKAGFAYQTRLYTPPMCVDTDIEPPVTYDIDSCWTDNKTGFDLNYTCSINRQIIECGKILSDSAGTCTYGSGCDCVKGGQIYPIHSCRDVAGTNYSCERSRRSPYPEMITCSGLCHETIGCV
ncbi:MAG: hypothetical protein K0B02_04935 [DPANN group archaeon]|nr:hypothetical protein [DPANN group archaeon]